MSKPLILNNKQWGEIHLRLSKEYPSSVMMMRVKMRKVLGFTVRNHRVWRHDVGGSFPVDQIHLDFYSEPKRTMFLLKFSDILEKYKHYDLHFC